MKEIEITGVLSVPDNETQGSVLDQFIEWVESRGYSFGGGVKDITDDQD